MDNTMGTLFSYSIFSGMFLACGYVAYRLLLSGEKQPGLNRAALLAVYAVSLLAMPASLLRLAMAPEAPAAGHMVEAGTVTAILTATPTPASAISHVLLCGFLAGLIAVGAWTLLGIARLRALIAGGRRVRREGYTLVLLKDCAVPFSFMNYIVMSEADALKSESMITAHELGHLRRRHWLDLLLAQAVCVLMWYNPAAWLMRRELRSVHEYQADGSAIQTDGVDARIYQLLLIEKAAGVRLQSLANSLNHSNIYKRITMMNKQFNRPARRMRVLALVPAIAMAAALVSSPAVASAINSAGNATLLSENLRPQTAAAPVADDKVTDKKASEQAPETLPQYPGGEDAMYKYMLYSLRYPEEAVKAGQEGRVVVRFTVMPDGTVSNVYAEDNNLHEALNREAVRVVKAMPAWRPARNKEGKAVECAYALPVTFKLPKQSTPTSLSKSR